MFKRALATALLLCSGALAAQDHHHHPGHAAAGNVNALTVEQAWARALPPNAPAAAVYLSVNNPGAADRLLSVSTPMAARAELHTVRKDGELLKMVEEKSVEVPANGALAFVPGGRHVMLMGLQKPLIAGEHFQLTLEFEAAGPREVRVDIRENAPDAHKHDVHNQNHDAHSH